MQEKGKDEENERGLGFNKRKRGNEELNEVKIQCNQKEERKKDREGEGKELV